MNDGMKIGKHKDYEDLMYRLNVTLRKILKAFDKENHELNTQN